MTMKRYSAITATMEHLLQGHSITKLEALVLFGAAHLDDIIKRLRRDGWVIQWRRISYAAAVKRLEGQALVVPPPNLPVREIQLTEYWVSR